MEKSKLSVSMLANIIPANAKAIDTVTTDKCPLGAVLIQYDNGNYALLNASRVMTCDQAEAKAYVNAMHKIYTADRETGTFIEEVASIDEAKKLIAEYEAQDKADGTFTEGFYDIVDEDHCSIKA